MLKVRTGEVPSLPSPRRLPPLAAHRASSAVPHLHQTCPPETDDLRTQSADPSQDIRDAYPGDVDGKRMDADVRALAEERRIYALSIAENKASHATPIPTPTHPCPFPYPIPLGLAAWRAAGRSARG